MAFFLVFGFMLIIGSNYAIDQINEVCDGGDEDSTIAEVFSSLYETADTIFCVTTSSGCVCYLSHVPVGGERASGTYISSPSPTVNNVQECSAFIESAFAEYGIDFDGVSEIQEYLDYFGDIEDAYSCSGICTYQSIYYFSDSNGGAPDKECKKSITDDVLTDIVQATGIAYLSTGCAFFLIWCIQYGLCCRDQNKRKKPGAGKSKRF